MTGSAQRWLGSALVGVLLILSSCRGSPIGDTDLDSLVDILGLLDSGRGCSYIQRFVNQEAIACVDTPIGRTSRPTLINGKGARLSMGDMSPWYDISPSGFERIPCDVGKIFFDKGHGVYYLMLDGRLVDFWKSADERCAPQKVGPPDSENSTAAGSGDFGDGEG